MISHPVACLWHILPELQRVDVPGSGVSHLINGEGNESGEGLCEGVRGRG